MLLYRLTINVGGTDLNDYVEIGATNIYGKRISFHSDDVAAYEINQLTKYNNEAGLAHSWLMLLYRLTSLPIMLASFSTPVRRSAQALPSLYGC